MKPDRKRNNIPKEITNLRRDSPPVPCDVWKRVACPRRGLSLGPLLWELERTKVLMVLARVFLEALKQEMSQLSKLANLAPPKELLAFHNLHLGPAKLRAFRNGYQKIPHLPSRSHPCKERKRIAVQKKEPAIINANSAHACATLCHNDKLPPSQSASNLACGMNASVFWILLVLEFVPWLHDVAWWCWKNNEVMSQRHGQGFMFAAAGLTALPRKTRRLEPTSIMEPHWKNRCASCTGSIVEKSLRTMASVRIISFCPSLSDFSRALFE